MVRTTAWRRIYSKFRWRCFDASEYTELYKGMRELRFTSEDLGIARQTTVSDEIRADRQISDLIQTHVEAQGGIKGEMSYGTYDELLEGAMNSSWEEALSSTSEPNTNPDGLLERDNVRVLASDVTNAPTVFDRIEFVDATGVETSTEPFTVGMGLKISGFTGGLAKNNRIVVVRSVGEDHIIVAPALAVETGVGVDAQNQPSNNVANNILFAGQLISNGVEDKSYTIEKSFTDVGKAVAYTGMVVKGMSLEVESESKITVGFDFMGRNGESFDELNDPALPTQQLNTADPISDALESRCRRYCCDRRKISWNRELSSRIFLFLSGAIGSQSQMAMIQNIQLQIM